MKGLLYLASAALFATMFVSCSDKDIYTPVEFNAQLSPENTFRVGEPIKFNISGNANFVTFWSGEGEHEYKHRNRTSVPLEDIEDCKLYMEVWGQYGAFGTADDPGISFYLSKTYPGFNGEDRGADLTAITALDNNSFSDFTRIPFLDNATKQTFSQDIAEYADNFVFLVKCKPALGPVTLAQRTYNVNATLKIKMKNLPEQVLPITSLPLIAFSPSEARVTNAYEIKAKATDRYVTYGTSPNMLFKGTGGANPRVQIENWICSRPTALNIVKPDRAINIKGYADILRTFEHKYDKPGTYTVTFVARTGNYKGESELVQSHTFTVIEPVE